MQEVNELPESNVEHPYMSNADFQFSGTMNLPGCS